MAQEDIYGNKLAYEKFINKYIIQKEILKKPKIKDNKRKYYCKFPDNLKYFKELQKKFEIDDLSYIRRRGVFSLLKRLTHLIEKDLKDAGEEERDTVILNIRHTTNSPNQLKRIEHDVKNLGRLLFKELPVFFKEFKIRTHSSLQKARTDKLNYEEFIKIVKFFSNDATMQGYLTIAMESLARPQELLYCRIGDLELNDQYAFINISSHGKTGLKKLLIIDSYPYLMKLLKKHISPENKEEFIFLNHHKKQLTPFSINKRLKLSCKKSKIVKPITCYSLKRFGVTFRRLKGDDDVTIQRVAGWTSTKQLRTYDQSNQDDVYLRELSKRGLIKNERYNYLRPKTKTCPFCGDKVGFADTICPNCNHLVDGNAIKKSVETEEEISKFLQLVVKELNPEKLKEIISKIS